MIAAGIVILILLGIHYAVVITLFAFGLRRTLWDAPASSPELALPEALPFVSVIIPARNEERCIAACVESVLNCDYPTDRFEVIVIDDASTDKTSEIVTKLRRAYAEAGIAASGEPLDPEAPVDQRLHLITLRPRKNGTAFGKRSALEIGIRTARGPLILATDADCIVPRGWIRTMAQAFEEDTGFVSGPVLYRTEGGAWNRMQALEFLSLVAVGAGAIGLNNPILCNGANIAYRKDVYKSLGGFGDKVQNAPGEEELLMHTVARSALWQVRFCHSPEAAVITDPVPTVRDFVHQRARWASLVPRFPDPLLLLSLFGIFYFYVLLIAGTIALPFAPYLWPVMIAAWGLKVLPEFAVVYRACRHFGQSKLLRYFIPAQLLHPLYVVYCATAGVLGRYTWKGLSARS